MVVNGYLVGGFNLPLWKMMESVGIVKFPIYGKKCSKPPTSTCSNFFRANSDLAAVVHHSNLPNRGSPFQEETDVFTMSLERLTSPNALCFWKDFKLQMAFGSGKINEFPKLDEKTSAVLRVLPNLSPFRCSSDFPRYLGNPKRRESEEPWQYILYHNRRSFLSDQCVYAIICYNDVYRYVQ